ncbi:hypothetical protein CAPTEDRAFT_120162 [Capitella teleta]|uniref:G-protein coupled receptors family 2 profile 2 domain-containing protein n=1 Tax=Capitella teleta TaxID=283909 RepID=R7T6M4_CAPTE|nr:hypothetical protein CAPTEDRAFT_120162 [Capitella teleta]|eukprot:ELT87015.1 hypothetical protein CAPTEDRAFT_120162 [Capitella teleta]
MNEHFKLMVLLWVILIMSHVCFLLGGWLVWYPVGCTVIAVCQHYLWLSSFFAMSAISYKLFKTFDSISTHNDSHGNLKCYTYILGSPAVIVASCVAMHLTGFFQYGSPSFCWITGSLNIGVSFALPVAVLLLINIVFFGMIVKSLGQSMDTAASATSRYNLKQRLILHVKLSSVMGFTWLSGLLANIPHLTFFRYIFLFLASSNGFFVAFAFSVNRRILGLLRDSIRSRNTGKSAQQKQLAEASSTVKIKGRKSDEKNV